MNISSVQFNHSVVSASLRPHGLQHARPPCPSPTLGVYTNSCPMSRWCHPTISSFIVPLLLPPSIFPSIRVFSNESFLHIRWTYLYAIAEPYGNSILYFLKNCQNVFQIVCIILLSHQQCRRVPISPHLPQTVTMLFFNHSHSSRH